MKSFGVFLLLLSLAVARAEPDANKWNKLETKTAHQETKPSVLQASSTYTPDLQIAHSQQYQSNILKNTNKQDIQSQHTQLQNDQLQDQLSQVKSQQDLAQQLRFQDLAEQFRKNNQAFHSQNQASQPYNQIQQPQPLHNQIEFQELDNPYQAQPYHNQNQAQQYHNQNQAQQYHNQNQAQQYNNQNQAQQYNNQNQDQQYRNQNQDQQYHNQNKDQQYRNQNQAHQNYKQNQQIQNQNQVKQYNYQDQMISISPVPQDQVISNTLRPQRQTTPTATSMIYAQPKAQIRDFTAQQQLHSTGLDNQQGLYEAQSIRNAHNKQNQGMFSGQQANLFDGLRSTQIKASDLPQSYRPVSAFGKGVQPIVLPRISHSNSASVLVTGLKNLPSLPALVYSTGTVPSSHVVAYSRPWHKGGAYVRQHWQTPSARYVYSHIL